MEEGHPLKKYLTHIEAAFSHRDFALYLLAGIGLLMMPENWFAPVGGAILVSLTYSYLKKNPGTLKDKNWFARPEIQRLGVVFVGLFWWWLMRSAGVANLFDVPRGHIGLTALILGPVSVYLICAVHSLMTWPKGASLCKDRETRKKLQLWTNATMVGFIAAFIFGVCIAIWFPLGIGSRLSGWLISTGLDADLVKFHHPVLGDPSLMTDPVTTFIASEPVKQFTIAVKSTVSLILIVLLWPKAVRLAGFLTLWLKRMEGRITGDVQESMTRVLRGPKTQLKIRESHGFAKNAVASLIWLSICYLVLFWLVGLSSGPLGENIVGWLNCSIADARMGMIHGAAANPNLRLFLAAIFALYGTVPLAVTGAVFLPYWRRRTMVLSEDGVFFPDGPYLAVGFRMLRLWSDFASVDVKMPTRCSDLSKAKLLIRFHSGGKVVLKMSQFSRGDAEKFLAALDENALECKVSNELIQLRGNLCASGAGQKKDSELGALSAQQFQSTIFVPHEPGSCLPDGETRVVRLLASRPLSCVYLVRSEHSGKLAIAKQFFLADDTDETRALRKCFEREYELLRKIDHPAISKILDVFNRNQSTYLVIDHAYGSDLRSLVKAQGARSEEKVIDLALQLCDIMTYLHGQDPPIIHRDLSPDNLVLADDGTLRVIDFGAAHQFLQGITGTIIGKQCYASPEQLQGKAGPASDVYSFGCMLHFLVTGEDPVALTQCDPSLKAPVSSAFRDLVKACTEFDEDRRPQTFSELKERLIAVRERPVQEVVERLRSVAESQGLLATPNSARANSLVGKLESRIESTKTNLAKKGDEQPKEEPQTQTVSSESDSGTVISLKEYQEQKKQL